MKELPFKYGRLSFDFNNFEMDPSLPDELEPRIHYYRLDENGLTMRPFIDFADMCTEDGNAGICWLHLTGTHSEEFWKHLAKFMDLSDEQLKLLKSPSSSLVFRRISQRTFLDIAKTVSRRSSRSN